MIDIDSLMLQDPPTRAAYRAQRTVAYFYQRAKIGAGFYALGCLVTAWYGGYFSRTPALVAGVLLAFIALTLLRVLHRPPADTTDTAATQGWLHRHWAMVHVSGIVWCAFLVTVGSAEGAASTVFFIATVCTLAYTSAACEIYAFDRRQALRLVALIQVPALAWFLWAVPELHSMVVVMLVYMVYQLNHILRRNQEYEDQIDLEHALITSRADVERLSQEDALTQLANRRAYEKTFRLHWSLARRPQKPLSLIVLDLDHFKSINDRLGHAAGDACLQHIAQVFRQQFRRSRDMVARIGGEEFAVILPETSAAEAQERAQAFCRALASSPAVFGAHTIALSASAGVGAVDWSLDKSPEDTFRRIDAACYTAKNQGRNQMVAA